jgi:hypothetical protein
MLWQRAWLVSELQHGGRPVDLSTPQPDFNGEQDASSGGGVGGLDRDVRRARLAHAAHFDALVEIRDAQTLRLAALQDVLLKKMAEDPRLKNLLPLQLETGFPPRLWLDNISYIIMEPDPRTFRLVRQASEGHLKIAETRDMSQMFREVRAYASHRLVETERDGCCINRQQRKRCCTHDVAIADDLARRLHFRGFVAAADRRDAWQGQLLKRRDSALSGCRSLRLSGVRGANCRCMSHASLGAVLAAILEKAI